MGGGVMRAVPSTLRWLAAAGVAIAAVVLPRAATAQVPCTPESPPLRATLKWQTPPTGPFDPSSPATPIPVVLQIANVSCQDLRVPAGTATAPYWLGLVITDARGAAITANAHREVFAASCGTRPVVFGEVLPASFAREFTIDDLRQLYPPPPAQFAPGRYTVRFVGTLNTADAFLTDCGAAFQGRDLVDLSAAQGFTIVSQNALEFTVGGFTFVGFESPVGPAESDPCVTNADPVGRNFGNTVPLKFEILDRNNVLVPSATALISAQPCSAGVLGEPLEVDLGQGSQPTNQAKFSTTGYHFNLDTSVLTRGQWQANVTLEDGSVHSTLLDLR